MRIIMIGCEYVGKSRLAEQISRWMIRAMGLSSVRWHAHFVLPHLNRHILVTERSTESPADVEEKEAILDLRPSLKEQLLRYMIWRHLCNDMYRVTDDYLAIDLHYGDAVYAPLYYGYGGSDDAFANRRRRAREWDTEVMMQAPDTVLVLLRASVDAVQHRMRRDPRPRSILKTDDVQLVLERFEEEFADSQIERRFALDTTNMSSDQTLEEFLKHMRPHFTNIDHLRIASSRPSP